MAPALHHVVYQSLATSALDESDLRHVLTQSRVWNTAHGLTGLLLHSNGSIMQVLEGAEADVRFIFARISSDSRHHNVVKLADGPVEQRQFAQWSMGFRTVNPQEFAHLQGYLDLTRTPVPLPADAHYRQGSSLHAVLANFLVEQPVRW